jgi:hypothetical protein
VPLVKVRKQGSEITTKCDGAELDSAIVKTIFQSYLIAIAFPGFLNPD